MTTSKPKNKDVQDAKRQVLEHIAASLDVLRNCQAIEPSRHTAIAVTEMESAQLRLLADIDKEWGFECKPLSAERRPVQHGSYCSSLDSCCYACYLGFLEWKKANTSAGTNENPSRYSNVAHRGRRIYRLWC